MILLLLAAATGDNLLTTTAIAKSVGFCGYERNIAGQELMELDEAGVEKIILHTDRREYFPDLN